MTFLWLILTVIILSLFNFGKSLGFSLFGDDWLALYRYHIFFNNFLSYFQLSNYMGNYDATHILMGLIYRVFDYNSFPYFLISLILRIIAVISFYPVFFSITRNRFIASIPSILFSSAYGGIETTNWVFNMTTYISISLLNIYLWRYISTLKRITLLDTFLQAVLIFLSFYFTPTRMHALIFIVPFLELLRLSQRSPKNILLILSRTAIFILPMILFRFATGSQWDKGYLSMLPDLQTRGFNILFYIVTNVGSIFFPDKIFGIFIKNLSQPNISELGIFLSKAFTIFLPYTIIIYLLSFSFKQKLKFFSLSLVGIIIFSIFFWLSLQTNNINNFGNLITFLETLIGGYTLLVFSFYFYLSRKTYIVLSSVGLISLLFTLAFLIAPWLAFSGDFPSDHRYLTVPAAAFIIAISTFCTILWKQHRQITTNLSVIIIIFLLVVNSLSLQLYFENFLSHGRKADYVEKLFKQLVSQVNPPKNDKPLVFLFLTDDQFNLYNAIGFGFDTHLMLIHPYLSKNLKALPKPIIVDNEQSLLSILKDPNSSELKRYGHPPAQIPLENVYSFYLVEDQLISNTDRLRKDIPYLLAK